MKITLDDSIRRKIGEVQNNHAFEKETGGILVGFYDASIDAIRITDMSCSFPSDTKERYGFKRRSKGHQEYMDSLWEKSSRKKAYLGEWHTHNQDVPIPSLIDRKSWKRISKENGNYEQSYFLIIGRKEAIIWSVVGDNIIEVERINKYGQ